MQLNHRVSLFHVLNTELVTCGCEAFWVFFLKKLFSLSAVKVMQPYSVVSTNGIAQIQCLTQPQPSYHKTQRNLDNQIQLYPYSDPEELRVTLLKGLHGNHEVCSSILNLTEPNAMHAVRKGEVRL